jgi:putative FmdB family regulatory protein
MPLYEYRCESCGHQFEVIQKFSDALIAVCPKCGSGPVVKLFSSPAIQFKGSGFYITDYARKGGEQGKGGEHAKGGEQGEGGKQGKGAEESKGAEQSKGDDTGTSGEKKAAGKSPAASTSSTDSASTPPPPKADSKSST